MSRTPLLLALVALLLTACDADQKDFDLDPRPHRDVISGLENVLYAPRAPKIEMTAQVQQLAADLASSLDGGRPPGPSKKAGDAVRTWGEGLAGHGEVGYVALDLPAARKSWQALRDANFRPEPFFKVADADLDTAQRSRSGNVDPMQLTLITLAAGELRSVLETGNLEAETFGEIAGEITADSPEGTAIQAEWSTWAAKWDRALGDVDWPARPPLAAKEVGAIYQQLKNAEKELVAVTAEHATGVTPKAERTIRLAAASELVAAAEGRIVSLRE